MEQIIKLEKSDIITDSIGINFQIKVPNGPTIILSQEALLELIDGSKCFFNAQKEETELKTKWHELSTELFMLSIKPPVHNYSKDEIDNSDFVRRYGHDYADIKDAERYLLSGFEKPSPVQKQDKIDELIDKKAFDQMDLMLEKLHEGINLAEKLNKITLGFAGTFDINNDGSLSKSNKNYNPNEH